VVHTAFVAYDSKPEVNRDTLFRATSAITNASFATALSWETLKVDGRVVIAEIIRAIDEASLCIADLTTLNPNVLFELGYALGHEKRIWILLERNDANAVSLWRNFRLLSGVGYAPWDNSDAIVGRFAQERPDIQVEPLWPQLLEGAQPQDPSAIFFMPALYDSDPNRALARVIDSKRRAGFNVQAADPSESRLEPLSWYAERIYESTCVVVHLESQRKTLHEVHNARAAFVAGIAAGVGRPLLMLAEEQYEAPFDYQEMLRRYRNAGDCAVVAEGWLKYAPVRPRSVTDYGRRRLAVELRALRFGEHVAENEVLELPTYFVETAAFRDLISGGNAVFVGRKGSGKSANMYLAAADLQADPRNFVVVIKPAAYDFAALVDLLHSLEGSLQDHAIDAIWKFIILSEMARVLTEELDSRPKYLPLSDSENDFLAFIRSTPFSLTDDVASRIELAVRWLADTGASGVGGVDDRRQLSEAMHQEWIGGLRDHLTKLLADRERLAILVDNLDKGWERRADLSVLSRLLLGLLSSVGKVERDLHRGDRTRKAPLKLSLALFLRSDIYSYLAAHEAREPDKINVRRVEWSDPAVLVSVLEQRFLASRPGGTVASELWERFFTPTVRGQATVDYILWRALPRPRDLIYFANACVHTAIDRRHERVEEADVIDAEALYSQFAFEALLVENGITISELEAVLFEFLAGPAVLEEAQALAAIEAAGAAGIRADQVLRRLKEMSFFGLMTGSERIQYPEAGREAERAEVLARKAAGGKIGAERMAIHPAYRSYLEIPDPDQ
jgi:hypothetical protein